MLRFFLRKLFQGAMLVVIASALTFALLSTAGGDALTSLIDNPQVSRETVEELRRVYGLDRPVVERYATWLASTLTGDLGESIYFRLPVSSLVMSRFVSTLAVSAAALAIAVSTAFLLGFLSARFRRRWLSRLITVLILFSASTPRLVLSLFALALAIRFSIESMFLPSAIVLAVPLIGLFLAQLNDGVDEAMREDYIQVARAKGLSESAVITRHVSRAVLNPVLTLFGLSIGALLTGSVIVESILGRAGIGSLMVTAVRQRDVPLVMGIVLVASLAVWIGNTLAEMLQMLNDPRLRSGEVEQ